MSNPLQRNIQIMRLEKGINTLYGNRHKRMVKAQFEFLSGGGYLPRSEIITAFKFKFKFNFYRKPKISFAFINIKQMVFGYIPQ